MPGFGYSPPPLPSIIDESNLDPDIREVSGINLIADSGGVRAYKLVFAKFATRECGEADKDNDGKMPVFGMAEQAIATGFSGKVTTKGEINNPGWSFSSGDLFVGNDGDITQIPPITGTVQTIGRVLDSNTIFLDISDFTIKRS